MRPSPPAGADRWPACPARPGHSRWPGPARCPPRCVTPHYDADGEVAAADLPGGVHLTQTDDPAGAERARSYSRDGVLDPLLA